MNELSCPKCKVGIIQRSTIYIEGERYNAFGCNKCDYGYWELFVDAKTYTVSTEGTADQFAKDISEMSGEEEIKMIEHYKLIENTTADQFILDMLKLGKPIETSLVGVFDNEGRGSRRDVDLPFHRDGDYSKEIAAKHSIDYVGLYCIKGGESKTILEVEGKEIELVLQEGQGVIMNNKNIRHARKGPVGDRLLLRVWIEE